MQCRTWNTGEFCGRDSKCCDDAVEVDNVGLMIIGNVEDVGVNFVVVDDVIVGDLEMAGYGDMDKIDVMETMEGKGWTYEENIKNMYEVVNVEAKKEANEEDDKVDDDEADKEADEEADKEAEEIAIVS